MALVQNSVHHTRAWHWVKSTQELCLCLFCEWACGSCCMLTVGNKCHWFCRIATGKIKISVFMHWPSQMKHTRFDSPCSCCSQNVVEVQTLAELIPKERDGLRCCRPLCHWEDEQRVGRIMSLLFCFQLVWFGFVGCPLPCVTPWSV